MIDEQPSVFRLDRRRGDADLETVPRIHARSEYLDAFLDGIFLEIERTQIIAADLIADAMHDQIAIFEFFRENARVFVVKSGRRDDDRLFPFPIAREKILFRNGCDRDARRSDAVVCGIAHENILAYLRHARIFAAGIRIADLLHLEILARSIYRLRQSFVNSDAVFRTGISDIRSIVARQRPIQYMRRLADAYRRRIENCFGFPLMLRDRREDGIFRCPLEPVLQSCLRAHC